MKHAMKLNLLAAAVGAGITGIPHASEARDIDLLFSRGGSPDAPQTGVVQVQLRGVTQLRLGNGATASFVDAVRYRIGDDDSIELIEGAVTVSAGDTATLVRLPNGLVGTLDGKGSAASFQARAGETRGHVMSGDVRLQSARGSLALSAGQFWAMRGADGAPVRIIAMGVQAAPSADGGVQDLRSGGVVAAAGNGLPVTFAAGLAAAGASADLVAAANRIELALVNPSIQSFPSGDFALLIQHSARLAAGYGDAAFPGASADIVRTYLGYLANGGSGAEFLTVYARIMTQYLDLLRVSVSPSGYNAAQVQDIRNFIAYQSRIGGFAALSASNRTLVEAYWSFLQSGADPARFGVAYTDLIGAYFAYVRGGGIPANFGEASQQTLNAYVKFLGDTGLLARLGSADRTLLQAYLQGMAAGGDGLAFITQYRQSLSDYYLWLEAGNLPSAFTATKIATLKSYLDLLDRTGLWNTVLGERAAFYREYYAYVQANADADLFPGLAAFSTDLYAGQLNAYYAFLDQGGLPSAYTAQDPAKLAAYLRVLIAAGKLDAALGQHAAFFRAYYEFVAAGNDPSKFTQLPLYVGYASAIQTYFAYLDGGGIPTAYTALTQAQVRAYLDTLARLGWWGQLSNAQIAFLKSYSAYLATGANPDLFNDLPSIGLVFANYTAAINAYLDFLAKGGLPSAYTALNVAALQTYIAALIDAGKLDALFGDKAAFLRSYYSFVTAGNDPSKFTQLPVYASYASAIQAYFAYLDGGGVPTAYTALTQEQVRAYLDTLARLGWWGQLSNAQIAFLKSYSAYLATGANPDLFNDLPSIGLVFANYTAAINAYLDFLAKGGLPSAYTALNVATLQTYIAALIDAGKLDALFGDKAAFLRSYYSFVTAGNDPSKFTQLPVYASYASAIQAYFAYLDGGGVPTAYTALTQEQVRAYLAALSQLGWWGALSSSQASFLQAYYAYLAGGGSPDSYSGLPSVASTYASYTAAVTAYLTYLRNGGLPSGYTAVDLATLQRYIAALIDAGKLDTAFGDQAAFLRNYYAYVAAGNDPSKFTQLPVYTSYASAIQAYFAYLDGGGVPTAYTALTQAQIRAYLDALSQLGWWGALTSGQITFLQAYYTYLAGGGNPDTYSQLPSNTTPTAPTTIRVNVVHAMNRPGTTYGPDVGNTGVLKEMKVDSKGVPTEGVPDISSILAFDPGTATSLEHTVTPEVTVGRFSNVKVTASGRDYQLGANQGLHYAYVQPVAAMPTVGTIRYDLAAATKPTWTSGALSPGSFTGTIVVGFGTTQWRAAIAGSIVMPGDATYAFATEGGLAGLSGITRYRLNSSSTYTMAANLTGTGRACSEGATCVLNVSMMLGGNGANGIAAGYGSSSSNSGDDTFTGAAGFKAAGTYVPPATVDMAGFAGKTLSGYRYMGVETGPFAGVIGGLGMRAVADATGLTEVSRPDGSGAFSRGSGTVLQAGAVSDVIAWSRWSKGWSQSTGPVQYQDSPFSLMVYKPVTSMPTSGTVSYTMVGGLDPIKHSDPSKTGKLTGSAAVAFGTTPKVGFDLLATFSPAETYAMKTEGGTTAPGVALSMGNPANPASFATSLSGCSGTCTYYLAGNLAGTGASHLGLVYYASGSSGVLFSGFAAFAKGDTVVPPAGNTGFANTVSPLVGIKLTRNGNIFSGGFSPNGYSATFDASGGITTVKALGNNSSEIASDSTLSNVGAYGSNAAWTTWRDGVRGVGNFTAWTVVKPLDLSQLPANNTLINYTIAQGGMAPTKYKNGAYVTGTAEGKAALKVGAAYNFGMEIKVTLDGSVYELSTAGGVASPSQILTLYSSSSSTPTLFGSFYMNTPTNMGGLCNSSSCVANLMVAIGGAKADTVAANYNVWNHSDQANNFGGSMVLSSAAGAASAGGVASTITPMTDAGWSAPALAGAPVRDWSRWEARGLRGGEAMAVTPVALPEGTAHADSGGEVGAGGPLMPATPTVLRNEAMARVERMFGGTLTFQR